MTPHAISIITPCFNDFSALGRTLASLKNEVRPYDELVLVDSSFDGSIVPNLMAGMGLPCKARCIWSSPSGVYPAQNLGIQESTSPWIQIINSGDLMMPGGRRMIEEALSANPTIELHVFLQQSGSGDSPLCIFHPGSSTLWPHQSIIVARAVHLKLGYYDEHYRLAADQIFLAKARRCCSWKLYREVLTHYDLSGLSDTATWANSMDLYRLWRLLGRNPIASSFKGYMLPFMHLLLKSTIGRDNTNRLKVLLLPHYTKITDTKSRSGMVK